MSNASKVKIALNLLYVIPNKVGGTQTYAEGILEEFNKNNRGFEIHVYCSTEYFKELKKKYGFVYHPIGLVGKSRVLRVLYENLILPILVLRNRFKIVHSLGYTCPIWLPCKNIVTIHDLNWHFQPNDFSFIQRHIWKLLVTISAKSADLIVTDSLVSKRSIENILMCKKNKVFTIYPGVALTKNGSKKTDLNKLKINKAYILTVSSLVPHKNVIRLIKAFNLVKNKLDNVNLVIVGLGGKDAELIKKMANMGDELDKIVFTGWVSNDELRDIYSNASAFIFISLYEGFGFPILEAYSHGLPSIISNNNTLVEISNNSSLVTNPYDLNEISASIFKLLTDENLATKFSRKGLRRAAEFTWKKTCDQLSKDCYLLNKNDYGKVN